MHIRMIIIIKDTYLHSLTAEGEKTLWTLHIIISGSMGEKGTIP